MANHTLNENYNGKTKEKHSRKHAALMYILPKQKLNDTFVDEIEPLLKQ